MLEVDDAIRAGKVTPAQRADAETRAAADPELFEAEIARAPQLVPFGELGSDEDAPMPAIELAPSGGLSQSARAVHLTEAATSLRVVAGSLSTADYPGQQRDAAALVADRDRWRLRAVAEYVLGHLADLARIGAKRGPDGPELSRAEWADRYRAAVRAIGDRNGAGGRTRKVTSTDLIAEIGLGRTAFYDYVRRYGRPL
jgi:hypothetical protein